MKNDIAEFKQATTKPSAEGRAICIAIEGKKEIKVEIVHNFSITPFGKRRFHLNIKEDVHLHAIQHLSRHTGLGNGD